jgi:hypothetical protein
LLRRAEFTQASAAMRLAAPANGLTVELLPFGLREPFFPQRR